MSPTRIRVTRLLCLGRSNREIAQCLGVVEDTVKTHLRAVFVAMRCSERTQVVVKLHSREMVLQEGYRPRAGVVDTR